MAPAVPKDMRAPFLLACSLLSLLSLTVALGGCADRTGSLEAVSEAGPDDLPTGSATSPNATHPWTLLVYGSADDAQAGALAADIMQVRTAEYGEGVNVVVTDGSAAGFTAVTEPMGGAPVRSAPNLADPSVMRALVRDVFRAYPAERRGLVLWTRGRMIEPGETAAAVRGGLADAGLDADRPLDFIALDSSMSPDIEAAFAFKDVAEVFLAVSASDGTSAFAYRDGLGFLGANPSASVGELLAHEERAWRARPVSGAALPRTRIALDTRRLENVARATASFSRAVTADPESALDVAAAMASAAQSDADGVRRAAYRDLAANVVARPNHGVVTEAARNLAEHIEAAALDGSASDLLVALPAADEASPAWAWSYRVTARAWQEASGWSELMTSFARFESSAPSFEAAVVDSLGQVVTADIGGFTGDALLKVSAIGPEVARVRASVVMLGEEGAPAKMFGEIGDAKAEAAIPWTRRIATVGGEDATRFTWRGRSALAGELSFGGAKIPAAVLVSGAVTSNVFVLRPASGGTSITARDILTVDQRATFAPAIKTVGARGEAWRYGRAISVATAGVGISSRPLGVGSYEVRFEAEGIWGTRSTRTRAFRISR